MSKKVVAQQDLKRLIVVVGGNSVDKGWLLGSFDNEREMYRKIEKRIPNEPYFIWDNKKGETYREGAKA